MTQGTEAGFFYIIEEGEVAFVDPAGVCHSQKNQINKLHIALTVGRMGFVGDELLLGHRDFAFTSVSIRQPSILYVCERSKFLKAWGILGREVMMLLRQQTAQRFKFRSELLAANLKDEQSLDASEALIEKSGNKPAYSNPLMRNRRSKQ